MGGQHRAPVAGRSRTPVPIAAEHRCLAANSGLSGREIAAVARIAGLGGAHKAFPGYRCERAIALVN